MPSTNSTEHLALNQWLGTDKPKMADFNADNLKLDAAMGNHLADAVSHLTENERNVWNHAVPLIGTYTGDGSSSRLIELGFQPAFGIIFAVSQNIVQTIGSSGNMAVYSAFVSTQGASQGVFMEETGITVLSSEQAVYNRVAHLNDDGTVYVYLMVR